MIDIGRPVDRQHDVAKVLKRNCAKPGPATVLTKNITQYPLVGGRRSTRSQTLPTVQATGQSIFEKVKVLMRLDHQVGPTVTGNGALCPEEVLTGDQIGPTCFAVPVYSPPMVKTMPQGGPLHRGQISGTFGVHQHDRTRRGRWTSRMTSSRPAGSVAGSRLLIRRSGLWIGSYRCNNFTPALEQA